jgi:NADP-dependent 3-hydroxy acid dehydrogenase YdfG
MSAFTGQTAIITGATGSVGSAVASQLIALGAKVVMVGRSENNLERMVRQSGWNPASVLCYPLDLRIEADIAAFINDFQRNHQELHILVHAAGTMTADTVQRGRLTDFDTQYQVNVRAPYQLTQSLLPQLVQAGGQVVFINSSAGVFAKAHFSQYAATKHALRAVADSLRAEINDRNVRVLSIYLGRTASRMQAAVHEHEAKVYQPERLLQPVDVASIVLATLQLPWTAEVTDMHIRPMLNSRLLRNEE